MFHLQHFHTHLLHHQGESITSVSISTPYQLCIASIYVVLAASPFSKDIFLHTRGSRDNRGALNREVRDKQGLPLTHCF